MNRLTLLPLSLILILVLLHTEANAASVPDAPTSLIVTAVSPTQINLFWSAPSNDGQSSITGYKIEYHVGSNSYSILVANTANTSTTYSHVGLTTDQTYTYHVYAINSVGTSTSSSESSATPTSSSSGTNPDAPTGLTAVPASPTQVNLSWSPPANSGGYPITGYKIEYRIGSGSYSTLVANTASTSTTYSHTGLTTGQVYIYRVYAITSFGTSTQPSSEAVAQPQSSSALAVPGIPTGLIATAVSPTQINLSWTAPSNSGGSAVTGYKIEAKSGSGSYSVLVANTANTATAYSHTGLATGTTYSYRVYAINSVGTGSASSESSATPTSSSSATVPGAPTSLTATSVSSTQNNLSWATPANSGGYPITGYKIEYRVGSGSYSVLVANTASTATTYSHTGLSASQVYVYRISAINYVGTGSASAESSTTTQSSSSNIPGSPVGLTATAASPTQVNLSWSPPANNGGSAITGYKIEVKKGTESYETLVSNTQSTVTSFSHTGLTKGSIYYYRVSAINAAGTGSSSEASATPKETTAPALTAIAVSPTSITLSWVPPSQTYKQEITGYKIEEKIASDTYKVITDNTGSTTSYSITGLTTGKSHTYVVSAYFTLGGSPNSNEATATPTTTSVPPPSKSNINPPGSPTSLVATSASKTQINLSWSSPSNTGGAVITGYKIEVKKGTGQYEMLTSSTQNTTTKYSHAGLTTGTTYVYRVYAINSVGISSPSQEASAIPAEVSANPPSPPILTVTHTMSNQANLLWSAPSNDGGAHITGYKVEYKIGSGAYMTLVNKATSTSYSHTGLLTNTYSYRVYAINSAGASPPSNAVSVTVSAPVKPATPVPDDTTPPVPEPEPKPKTHIPGFPDPTKDPQYYVGRYNNEPEYKAWFDRNFPGESIYDVVGATDPNKKEIITTRIPGFPDPTKDADYYIYLYKNEPSFKAWYDANFPSQTIYSLFKVQEPEPVPDAAKCGAGTHLDGGICVLDAVKAGGGCLIATAAYGTELSPQVQQLREIRDNVILNTKSGTALMTGFNQFYYSFSPTVADWERQSPIFKEMVKITITPMLSTLSVLNNADSESEMLVYGAGIILLNAGIYLGIPSFSILIIKNRSKIRN